MHAVKMTKTEFYWQMARYLGVSEDKIVRIDNSFQNVIWVHVEGCRPMFISRKSFRYFLNRVPTYFDGMTDHEAIAEEAKMKKAQAIVAKKHPAFKPRVYQAPKSGQSVSPFLPNYKAS